MKDGYDFLLHRWFLSTWHILCFGRYALNFSMKKENAHSCADMIVVGIGISLLFYRSFGNGNVAFQVRQIVDLILGIVPVDPVSPLINAV